MNTERAFAKRQWVPCYILLTLVLGSARSTEAGRKHHEARYSTLAGNTIQLHPSGVTMQIPQLWVARRNMALTRDQLKRAQVSGFLPVVADAAFNLRDCAFEVENLSPSFWLGIYIVDQPTDGVIKRIYEKGRKTPAGYRPGSLAKVFPIKTEGPWEHARISVQWWFDDYGVPQVVDFYVESLPNQQTMVFVTSFNGTGDLRPGWEDDPEITKLRNELLESVVVPKAPQNLAPQ